MYFGLLKNSRINCWIKEVFLEFELISTYLHKLYKGQICPNGKVRIRVKCAGIEHHGWHITGLSWYGPAVKIVALAHLTTHLTRFIRAHMFGPGRCTSPHTSVASSGRTCLVQVGAPHHTPHSLHPGAHVWSR